METQFDNYSFLIVQAPASLYKDKLVFIVNGSTKGQGRTYPFKPAGFYYSDGSNWIFKGATNTGGTGTVTSVDITSNATAITITGNPITTAGAIDLGFNGAITDYVDGTGALQVFPTSLGTVTSVDLTMPSAFAVTGNPITTAGTLAVTGAGTTSQYIRGDGSLANFPTSTGGGASVSYYLNGSINQGTFSGNTYYQMSKIPVIGAGTNFTIATNGYISQFITDANDPSQLNIPAGNWNFEMYFQASSNGGSPSFYVELYKWDGATFTLIASSSTNPEGITNGTTVDLYITALAVPATTLSLTDRLAIRVYVNNSGRTITLHTEDNNLCQVITTFSTGVTALNGLTAQVQTFATGTTGTDFNISSVTATHTFNLPVASAANTGKLSSADWTTFNNKGTVTSIATAGLISGGTITNTGTITTSVNTNRLIGRSTAGVGVMEEITLGTGLSFTGTTLNVTGSTTLVVGTTPITSGTVGRLLFEGTGNVLQENANLFYDVINGRLSLNQGSSPSARLDILSPGTSSTDLAIRVRNNGNSINLLEQRGNGDISLRSNANSYTCNLHFYAFAGTNGWHLTNGTSFGNGAGVATLGDNVNFYSLSTRIIQMVAGSTPGYSYWNQVVFGSAARQKFTLGNSAISSFTFYFENTNFGIGLFTGSTTEFGTNATNTFALKTGVAPTTGITLGDGFQMYSADIVAGNAAPHFRTENNDIVKIYSIGGWGTPTGTLTRTTFATYAGATAGVLYDQTIMQNLIDAQKITSERLAALISDLKTGQQLLKA
jgi:hypothetical protein